MRFRPEQHLRRPRDIRTVRELGRRFDCRAFTVWWMTRGSLPPGARGDPAALPTVSPLSHPRVCVIASTAAVGRAVHRNRARRRLRELFRRHQDELPRDCDLLLIARSGTTTWPMPELEKRFSEACRQVSATGVVTGEK
ncbi:MAG: ribonuclease P protein component [Verrucomicrobia bacterium]|jgi:ribonuclease P protein component|nr:ribonuclease P protein component [Verrucomicrobiota bacterium]